MEEGCPHCSNVLLRLSDLLQGHSGWQAVVIPPMGLALGSQITGRDAVVRPHRVCPPTAIWGLGDELPDVPSAL